MILELKMHIAEQSSAIEVKFEDETEILVQGVGPGFSNDLLDWVESLIKFCRDNQIPVNNKLKH